MQRGEIGINHVTGLDLIQRCLKRKCTPNKNQENKLVIKVKERVYDKSNGIVYERVKLNTIVQLQESQEIEQIIARL